MSKSKYLFGDIVVVDEDQIGIIVKSWGPSWWGGQIVRGYYYEVYVRSYNAIKDYDEADIERYRVRHKYLDEEELEWQKSED